MSLIADGRAALTAMLADPDLFDRVKPGDYSTLAVKLAKKQIIAAKLNLNDQRTIRSALGEDIYLKTLDTLSASQMKMLARRLDGHAGEDVTKTAATAQRHIRALLDGSPMTEPETATLEDSAANDTALATETITATVPEIETAEARTKNKYFGRKAFRTGR